MATEQSTVDYLLDQLPPGDEFRTRKMFGEYALYLGEKVVAFICDNQLFVKPTPASTPYEAECDPAPPYPGAKDYWRVPEEKWTDREWLSAFLQETADQVPEPKPKKKK